MKSGCSFSDFTATKSGDIQSVDACETVAGSITLKGSELGDVNLNGIKEVYGDLALKEANSTRTFNAPSLQLVSGKLELTTDVALEHVNLAQLTTVGTLNCEALPKVEHLGLSSGITSAESVQISDTGLSSLDGINVYKLKNFDVNNNAQIKKIDAGLKKVTESLYIGFNAKKVEVEMDDLKEASNLTFSSVSSLSVANLTNISGSFTWTNSSAEQLRLDSVEVIKQDLTINNNEDLEEVELPKLEKIGGGLTILKNDHLDSIDLGKLKKVGGAVDVKGDFSNATIDKLEEVDGTFTFDTEGEFDCDSLSSLDVKAGKKSCHGKKSSSSSGGGSLSSGGSSSGGDSKGGDSKGGSKGGSSSGSNSSSSKSSGGKLAAPANYDGIKLFTLFAGFVLVGVSMF